MGSRVNRFAVAKTIPGQIRALQGWSEGPAQVFRRMKMSPRQTVASPSERIFIDQGPRIYYPNPLTKKPIIQQKHEILKIWIELNIFERSGFGTVPSSEHVAKSAFIFGVASWLTFQRTEAAYTRFLTRLRYLLISAICQPPLRNSSWPFLVFWLVVEWGSIRRQLHSSRVLFTVVATLLSRWLSVCEQVAPADESLVKSCFALPAPYSGNWDAWSRGTRMTAIALSASLAFMHDNTHV